MKGLLAGLFVAILTATATNFTFAVRRYGEPQQNAVAVDYNCDFGKCDTNWLTKSPVPAAVFWGEGGLSKISTVMSGKNGAARLDPWEAFILFSLLLFFISCSISLSFLFLFFWFWFLILFFFIFGLSLSFFSLVFSDFSFTSRYRLLPFYLNKRTLASFLPKLVKAFNFIWKILLKLMQNSQQNHKFPSTLISL